MEMHRLREANSRLVRQRNAALSLAGALALAVVASGVVASAKDTSVVMVPSSVDEFRLSSSHVSTTYLLAMTRDAAALYLNRHPHDTDYFKQNLVRLAHPSFHDDIIEAIDLDEANNRFKLGRRNWMPTDVCRLSGDDYRTEILGSRETYVGGELIATETVARQFRWRLEGTRLYLVDMLEMDPAESECLTVKFTENGL